MKKQNNMDKKLRDILAYSLISNTKPSTILKFTIAIALFFILTISAAAEGVVIQDGRLIAPNGIDYNSNIFYIDSANSRVGIGTDQPGKTLEVGGDLKANELCIGSDCRTAWPSSGSEFNPDPLIIDSTNQRIGIGIDQPENTLDVSGDIKADEYCIGSDCITSWPTGTIVEGSGDSVWFEVGNDIKVGNKKVGIGANPEFQLDVRTVGDRVARFGSASGGNELTIDVAGGQGLASIVAGAKVKPGTNNYIFTGRRGASKIMLHDGSIHLFTSNSATGDTTNDGIDKIASGLNSGEQKLSINRNGLMNLNGQLHIKKGWRGIQIEGANDAPHRYDFVVGCIGGGATCNDGNEGNNAREGGLGIYDETARQYRFSIRKDGNVGIKKTNAKHPLDVSGRIASTGTTPGMWFIDTNTGEGNSFVGSFEDYVGFWTPGERGRAFAIHKETGDTGIGTNRPTAKLDVRGDVKAEEFCLGDECITEWSNQATSSSSSSSGDSGSSDDALISFGERDIRSEAPSTANHRGSGTQAATGLVYRVTGNPQGGEPIFQIRSSGQAVRFFAEHNGYTGATHNSAWFGGNLPNYFKKSVGIGTKTPTSELQVSGYIQIDDINEQPPEEDCNSDSETGRMKIDTSSNQLWICNGADRGWDWLQLQD
tara:strand:+ start:123 stop:2081 length:1959 start_codon:yes stop_codon:yes gene_type:complete